MASAKTPQATIARLTEETLKVCQLPETKKRLQDAGAEVSCVGSQEFAQLIAEDSQRWSDVVKRGNIKSE